MKTRRLTGIVFFILTSIIVFFNIEVIGQTSTLTVEPDGDVINTGWSSVPMFSCLNTPAYGAISANKGQLTGQVSMQNPVANGTYTGVALSFRLKKTGASAENLTVNIVVQGTPVKVATITVNTDTYAEYTIIWDKLHFSKLDMSSLEVYFKSSGNSKLSFDHLDCELAFIPSDPFAMVFPPRFSKLMYM
jgi:hypothetical protein